MPESEQRSVIASVTSTVRDFSVWLVIWAVVCAIIIAARFGRLWNMVGTWEGVLFVYLALYFGGLIAGSVMGPTDSIKSPRLRFAVQMFLCLLLAIAVCAVPVFATI